MIFRFGAKSDLARQLRSPEGAPLGEVFTFISALYFRGKLAYARAFARPPSKETGIWIITPSAGLLPHDARIGISRLREFSRVPIRLRNKLYRYSLLRAVKNLANGIGGDCEVILLGSIATGKYLEILVPVFADRLRVPAEFIGRGDMSRGALLLRSVRQNRELDYLSATVLAQQIPKRRDRSASAAPLKKASAIELAPSSNEAIEFPIPNRSDP